MKAFGDRATMPIIAFQMALGIASIWIIYRLILALFGDIRPAFLGAFLWSHLCSPHSNL